MNDDPQGFYAVLDVSSRASLEDIKKQYRTLALKHHPDRENGDQTIFRRCHMSS